MKEGQTATTRAPKRYSSNLTDAEWDLIKGFIPPAKTKPRKVDVRQAINGILYVLKTRCQWEMMPGDFPPKDTCYYWFSKLNREGVWQQIQQTLMVKFRQMEGRNALPTVGIVDSQTVQSTEVAGNRGYDAGKKKRPKTVYSG